MTNEASNASELDCAKRTGLALHRGTPVLLFIGKMPKLALALVVCQAGIWYNGLHCNEGADA